MEVNSLLLHNSNTPTQQGSHEQFQTIFKTYYPRVVRKVMTIVKNKQAAEDIGQEVFMKLYHADWECIEHLPAWLMTTAIHTTYNKIRSEKRLHAREEKQSKSGETHEVSIEETIMKQEEDTEVQNTLLKLNERDRLLLLLKYSGYSYQDIANAIHIEPSSVGTLLARAKRRFKQVYTQMKGEGSHEMS